MAFAENYMKLKSAFDLRPDEASLPEGDLVLKNFSFNSSLPHWVEYSPEDNLIEGNFHFRYPVIMPSNLKKASRVIIFLHGLNERSWHKHLSGAGMLAEKIKCPVIMFPLSFHINRGLPEWTDYRKMAEPLQSRRIKYPGLNEASVINIAMSRRLTENPGRFIVSGFQSITDLISLVQQIREGRHPLFEAGTEADLFAYSISCMMLQSLMISDQGDVLHNSRIVMFAGGSLFSQINGISRFIMDNVAFQTIRSFYLRTLDKRNNFLKGLRPLFMEHKFGKAFRTLISGEKFKKEREQGIGNYHDNLLVLALQKDHIMPVQGIRTAMGERFCRSENFRILDFPYPYTHENPFPVLNTNFEKQVEKGFLSVYDLALRFFDRGVK